MNLIQATNGNFYGTTQQGGANPTVCGGLGCGTIFQITPTGVLTTLYSFCAQSGCTDGEIPLAALMQASDGNFYGTTRQGGANTTACSGTGCGTIFRITPAGVFTTLYSFCSQSGCSDGVYPGTGGTLVQGSNGNFYGVTSGFTFSSGPGTVGTVFEMTPTGTLTTLYSFCLQTFDGGFCPDGLNPQGGLLLASDGNFYGTTSEGGVHGTTGAIGTVFKMTASGTLTTIYTFCGLAYCDDGAIPKTPLFQGINGNLFGLTSDLGTYGGGTIFEIVLADIAAPSGPEGTLYNFCTQSSPQYACQDGEIPASLIQASNGTLYGTAADGGMNHGTIFTLPPGPVPTLNSNLLDGVGAGQPVTFTAMLPANATGTITFSYGSTILCNAVPVVYGTSCTTSALTTIGIDVITATYSGDATYASTSSTFGQYVDLAATTTLTSSVNPSVLGQQVNFTVTVTSLTGGLLTGTVSLSPGLGSIDIYSAQSPYTVTFPVTSLKVGNNFLSASFYGGGYAPSTSNEVVQVVNPVPAVTLQANIAGSTAFWLEAGEAAYTLGGTTATCAWTALSGTNGTSFVVDSRYPGLGNLFTDVWPQVDYGDLWVTWTPGTAGGTCQFPDATSQVWAYIGMDSVTANRCFFAQPQCRLNVGNWSGGSTLGPAAPGANALPGIIDTPLPANVLAAFNGQPITMAATDILPVDAKFSMYSTRARCGSLGSGTQFIGLGYGQGNFPLKPVTSYFSQNYSNVNDFNIYGNDPLNGNPIPPYSITPVGALPVIVAVNTSNPNGFGSANITNMNRMELGLLFTGVNLQTADVLKQPYAGTGATYYGVSALIPSPLSGSYNIFEHSITNNKELYDSLDSNSCGVNPLDQSTNIGSITSHRYRVIGTNEMLTELQSTEDSIGFELWSAENFAGTSNIRYVSVDGVDPFFSGYSDGTIPQSGNGLLPNVTFAHVADGTYPIWNEERLISSPANAGVAATFAGYTQAQVSFGPSATRPDFIPDSQLNVFHAHFAPSGVTFNATNTPADGPKVCGPGSNPEDGGDVGGITLSLQAGADICVLHGNYGQPGGIGPTNLSSFGVHQ